MREDSRECKRGSDQGANRLETASGFQIGQANPKGRAAGVNLPVYWERSAIDPRQS